MTTVYLCECRLKEKTMTTGKQIYNTFNQKQTYKETQDPTATVMFILRMSQE